MAVARYRLSSAFTAQSSQTPKGAVPEKDGSMCLGNHISFCQTPSGTAPFASRRTAPTLASRSRLKVSSAGGGTEGGGADRRPVTGGRLDEAALSLGAEPVAVAPDGQDVTVVQEPVEDCGRDD